jgi:plastocyanin
MVRGKRSRGALCAAAVALVVFAVLASGARRRGAGAPGAVAASGDCSSELVLCLGEGRFALEATWTAPDGSSGPAYPVPLTSESGYFWFFSPDNVELAVKSLNGCGVNGHHWVFAAGLTSVQVKITVTDTSSGEVRTYENPQGTAFRTITDTAAFESCTEGELSVAGRHPEEPAEGAALPESSRSLLTTRPTSVIGCEGSDTALCIRGRFQIEASWQTASGATGPAYAVPLTSDAGYFWFFEPSNVEVIAKALDACTLEQGNWLFAAGMTNVGVQIRVTDTYTGEVKVYTNPLGTPFVPVQDTGAFAFCPTPTPTPTVTPTPTRTPTRTPGVHTVSVFPKSDPYDHYGFFPNRISVRVGDTVQWSWPSGGHSVTAGSGWDSGVQKGPFTFSQTFTKTGTFDYRCFVNHPPGRTGTLCGFPPPNRCRPFTTFTHEHGTVIVRP